MNIKLVAYCIFFLLSSSLKAQSDTSEVEEPQDFEFESMTIKGFHQWERTMLDVLNGVIYLEPTSPENTFVKALKIKTVRKYLTEIGRDSVEKKRLEYEIKYNTIGNITSERTSKYICSYIYNDKGFLIDIESEKIDGPLLYAIGTTIHYKEKKIWTEEFPYSKLEKHIFLNSEEKVSSYIKYSYIKNVLISKITYYNSNDKYSYFYSFEYEFY